MNASKQEDLAEFLELNICAKIFSFSKETLSTLLDHMLHEVHVKSSSDSLVGGISVLLTLLEVNKSK